MTATRLTGLFERKTKDGETYLAGNLSRSSRLVILRNRYKRGGTDPDYYVFLASRSTSKVEPPQGPEESTQ